MQLPSIPLLFIILILSLLGQATVEINQQWLFGSNGDHKQTLLQPGGVQWPCITSSSNGDYYTFFGGHFAGELSKTRNSVYIYNLTTSDLSYVTGDISKFNPDGNYSFPGIYHPDAAPSGRQEAACTTNKNKTTFYVFGGRKKTNRGKADLWEFSFSTHQWKLIWGDGTSLGVTYGTKNVSSDLNKPGHRFGAHLSVINDEIWLSGGTNGYGKKNYGDIWRFSNGNWTWIAGGKNNVAAGNYVDFGIWSSTFEPRGRKGAGYFDYQDRYLFWYAGTYDLNTTSDMFEFDTVTHEFRWIYGNDSLVDENPGDFAYYTSIQDFNPINTPGYRSDFALFPFNDSLNFYIFSGNPVFDSFADLWFFNGSQWAYWGGSLASFPIVGDEKEIDSSFSIGLRGGAGSHVDSNGNLVLFGGFSGFDTESFGDGWIIYPVSEICSNGGFSIPVGNLNDPPSYSGSTSLCYCNETSVLNTTKSDIINQTCIPAPFGVQAGGFNGSNCQEGFYRESPSTAVPSEPCSLCPPLKICPGGGALPKCLEGFYNLGGPSSPCKPCVDKADCSSGVPSCINGYYHLELEQPCKICPSNSFCLGGQETPSSEPGYFESSLKQNSFILCTPSESCLGNNTCSTGYTGYICSQCDSGYYLSFGHCQKCSDFSSISWLFLLPVMFVFVYGSIYSVSEILKRQSPIPIFFDFLQCSAIIGSVTVPDLPQFFIEFNSYLGLFFFDMTLLFPPECFITSDSPFYLRKFFLISLFGILALFYALFYTCHLLVRTYQISLFSLSPTSPKFLFVISDWIFTLEPSLIKYWYLGGLNLAAYISFPLIIRSFLEYFDCTYLPDGSYALIEDPAQQCYSSDHLSFIFSFVLVLLCIGLLYPLFALYQISRANQKWLKKGKTIPQHFLALWGFYFALCKPQHAFFDVLLLVRRFLIALWSVFFSTFPLAATMLILVSIFSLIIYHSKIQPYNSPVLNRIFSFLGFSLFLQCLIMVGYASYSTAMITVTCIILFSPVSLPFARPGRWMQIFSSISKQEILDFISSQVIADSPPQLEKGKSHHRRSTFELALPVFSSPSTDPNAELNETTKSIFGNPGSETNSVTILPTIDPFDGSDIEESDPDESPEYHDDK